MNKIKRLDEYISRKALSKASGFHTTYLSFLSKREELPRSAERKIEKALDIIIHNLEQIRD